jgi:hypothetical protein
MKNLGINLIKYVQDLLFENSKKAMKETKEGLNAKCAGRLVIVMMSVISK